MEILLTTFNARYTHTALGLRYLYANMQHLQVHTAILEFTIHDTAEIAAEKLLAHRPRIIGIGAYIWNASLVSELVGLLRLLSPQTLIIVGGPQASYEPFGVDLSGAHYIIQGQADTAFFALCEAVWRGTPPAQGIVRPTAPNLNDIALPYEYYSDEDIAHRIIYVEASRGCPFLCEFCLSSLDEKIVLFEIERFLAALERLWQRGVREFKFIDRTFNSQMRVAHAVLDFFLSKPMPYFAHFEVVPDHFPAPLKAKIALFDAGALQLEVGIQTLDEEVANRISRPLNRTKVLENLDFLTQHTQAHLHVDLIVGLPGETLAQFGRNLDTLVAHTKCEIQIGILKKLSGTALARHDVPYEMLYHSMPPFDVLQTSTMRFEEIQAMKRFTRYWEILYNSERFPQTLQLLWSNESPFEHFWALSQWLYVRTDATHAISLERMAKLLFDYLIEHRGIAQSKVAQSMLEDFAPKRRSDAPKFLHDYMTV